jgi:hypothetical protein
MNILRKSVVTRCVKKTEPKICRNCRHFRNYGMITLLDKCTHPSSQTINLVDGQLTFEYASLQREYGSCGVSGMNYEEETNKFVFMRNNSIGTFLFIIYFAFIISIIAFIIK